ncbi:MAG: hypothetical protein WC792_03590 [Candidatus Micrarchaeia archaeon]|jgi:hypothetical protein
MTPKEKYVAWKLFQLLLIVGLSLASFSMLAGHFEGGQIFGLKLPLAIWLAGLSALLAAVITFSFKMWKGIPREEEKDDVAELLPSYASAKAAARLVEIKYSGKSGKAKARGKFDEYYRV